MSTLRSERSICEHTSAHIEMFTTQRPTDSLLRSGKWMRYVIKYNNQIIQKIRNEMNIKGSLSNTNLICMSFPSN